MKLADIVARVNEWADWYVRLETSGLGYPSNTAEARHGLGGRRQPGPIVPQMILNRRAVEVDRAIRQMPADMRALLVDKHVDGTGTTLERAKAFAREQGVSLATYYRIEKDAYWYIGGYLNARRESA